MFGEGGVFEEYGSSENRSMWTSKFGVFTKSVQADFLTPSQRHTGTCLLTKVTGSTAELSSHPESHLVPISAMCASSFHSNSLFF